MKISSLIKVTIARWVWLLGLTALTWAGSSTVQGQPITNNAVLVALDFDGDAEVDATYEQTGSKLFSDPRPYYRSGAFLRNTAQLRFVRSTSSRIDFLPNQTVSTANAVYVNSGEGNSVALLAYDAEYFDDWRYYAPSPFIEGQFYTNKTEVLVGFRLTSLELGTKHHGWLRFTRPNADFTTPFDLVAYDWNPLPDAPIGAGEPPPPPPLQTQFTEEGLSLTWDARFTGLVLEWTDSLNPPAYWQPVEGVSGGAALVPLEAAGRFYRLRRP